MESNAGNQYSNPIMANYRNRYWKPTLESIYGNQYTVMETRMPINLWKPARKPIMESICIIQQWNLMLETNNGIP